MPDGQENQRLSVSEFAKRLKEKSQSPKYAEMDDADLVERFVRKNPVYADKVDLPKEFKLLHTTSGHSNLDQVYEDAGRKYNVDPNLLVEQGRQETINFKPSVLYNKLKSPAGAAGAGQFMAGTAKKYGVDVNDPVSSIHGQAKYMRELLDQFDGNEDLALAGYNAGEHRKSLRQGKIPNIPETQNYVKTIKGNLSSSREKTVGTLRSLLGQMQPQPEVQPPAAQTPEGVTPETALQTLAPVAHAIANDPAGRVMAQTVAEQVPEALQNIQTLGGSQEVPVEQPMRSTKTVDDQYVEYLKQDKTGKPLTFEQFKANAAPVTPPAQQQAVAPVQPQETQPQPVGGAAGATIAPPAKPSYTEKEFNDWAKYTKTSPTPEARKTFEAALSTAGPGSVDVSAEVTPPKVPEVSTVGITREPSITKLKGSDISDDDLAKTDIKYTIDLSGVKDKNAYADQVSRAKLKEDFGLTDEQLNQIVPEGQWTFDDKDQTGRVVINRGQLAALIGKDKVRQDLRREQGDIETSPEFLAQNERTRQTAEAKTLPSILGDSWEEMEPAKREVLQSPFTLLLGSLAGKTDEEMFNDLRQYQPTEEEVKQARAERPDLTEDGLLGSIKRGLGSAATSTAASIYGIARALGENTAEMPSLDSKEIKAAGWRPPEWFTSLVRKNNALSTVIGQAQIGETGFANNAAYFGADLIGSIPRYVLLGKVLGGRPVLFATDAALTSAGTGATPSKQVDSVAKGLVFDGFFNSAPKISAAAEKYGIDRLKDLKRPLAGTAPALEGEIAEGPIKGGAYPAERLAAKVFGTGASLGYVTVGGATVSKVSRAQAGEAPNTFADLQDGLRLAILQVAAEHGGDAASVIGDMAGKVFRIMKGNKTEAATITPEGEIKLLKGTQPGEVVDMDFVLDPVDNTYKATNPFEHQPKQLPTDVPKADEGVTEYKESDRGQAKQKFEEVQTRGETIANEARQRADIDQAKIDATIAERNKAEAPEVVPETKIETKPESQPQDESSVPAPVRESRPFTFKDIDAEMDRMFPGGKIDETAFRTAEVAGAQVPAIKESGAMESAAATQEPASVETAPEIDKAALRDTYKKAFQLPLLDPTNESHQAKLGRQVSVTFESPSGKTVTKKMPASQYQKQLEAKGQIVQKIVDCLHAEN